MYRPKGEFFSKVERHFGFPHDSNCQTTKRKVRLGPETVIQVSGKLFCQKIGPMICCTDVLRFPGDLEGGGVAHALAT